MDNPLAVTPYEVVFYLSSLVGLAVSAYVLIGAARGRYSWVVAVVMVVVSLGVPVVGPVLAVVASRSLSRNSRTAPQPSR